ncbi:MAG: electron transport complex subunit RsxC [Paludibacteraceae bacterium]|nr:electron transport complex subunit RsxC [Paludibacteraceae bacterium]
MRTFKIGGIHPNDAKLSAGVAIEVMPLPLQVSIPVAQHIGAPATVVVAKGDKVKAGTLIAQATGFVSANVHSSVSGTVAKIDNEPDASGNRRQVVVIDVEGDEWEENVDLKGDFKRTFNLSSEEIIAKIKDAGIVGMGGATFPTHVKLMPPPGKVAEVLIINAVECEPYLTSDHALMLEHADEVLIGVQLLMRAAKVNRAMIGIENNKKDAIKLLQEKASKLIGIEICPLRMKYPQGSEKQLIDALIGRQVPSGALPIEVGAIVQNVGTAYAVYETIVKNKPLVERIVTVTGQSLAQPKNVLVRIGTPMSALIAFAGGMPENTGKVIAGGPMMGRAVVNVDAPIQKGSSGILLMPEALSERVEMDNCIRCGKCVSVCCMGLQPYLLMNLVEKKMWQEAEQEAVYDCLECGSCSFTCPAHRPLLDYIRYGKSTVMRIMRERSAKK